MKERSLCNENFGSLNDNGCYLTPLWTHNFFLVTSVKSQLKKERTVFQYFGFKQEKVRFTLLDTFISHDLFVMPKRKYE